MDKIIDIGNKSSLEISDMIDEKEKELSDIMVDQNTVDLEIIGISKNILELQGKKKDLQLADSKAKHLIKTLNIQLRFLRNQFWRVKNEGR